VKRRVLLQTVLNNAVKKARTYITGPKEVPIEHVPVKN
jgi:hypothetical protein